MTRLDKILQEIQSEAAQQAIALYTSHLTAGKISRTKFEQYVAKVRKNTGVKA